MYTIVANYNNVTLVVSMNNWLKALSNNDCKPYLEDDRAVVEENPTSAWNSEGIEIYHATQEYL